MLTVICVILNKAAVDVYKRQEGRVWWMLTTLTDQILGEIPHMRYIDSFDVLEEPKAEPSLSLIHI